MIQAHPTNKGTGIEIYGDYGDLSNLYETVRKIAHRSEEYDATFKGQFQILMNFAYEIRKAYSNERLYQKMSYDSDHEVYYFGFQYLWTDLLYTISALRYNAGYVPLTKLDQATLYLIEFFTKKAIIEFDPQGAENIQHFIGQRLDTTDELVYLINGAIDSEYLSEKPTIRRFRNIPNLLISYSSHLDKYRRFKLDLQIRADELNCGILDIEYENLPDVIW